MRSLLTAATISLAFTLFLTPLFIRLFEKLGWGQVIRTPENAHNPNHHAKRGTPTMGGVIFILGSIVGYLVGTLTGGAPPSISGILVIWMMVGLGAVGFIDDYMKVRQQRSLGLSGWRKVVGQILVAVPFGIVALNFPNRVGQTPASPFISFFRDIPMLSFLALGAVIGWIAYLVWISFLSVAWSNATNLTDGLDGLATGAGIFTMAAFLRGYVPVNPWAEHAFQAGALVERGRRASSVSFGLPSPPATISSSASQGTPLPALR